MSLIGQEVFSAPGELVSVLMNGGPIDPNPIVSSILVVNYVSSSQVLCDGVDTQYVLTEAVTTNALLGVSTILTGVTTANPTGSLYIDVQSALNFNTSSIKMEAGSTIDITSGQGLAIFSYGDVNIASASSTIINGTDWNNLISTVNGLVIAVG